MGLVKATIGRLDGKGEPFTVLFNPEQYTQDRKNNFAQITVHGLSSPLLQFSHGELQTLQMELFFDSREKHVVNTVTRTTPNSDLRLVLKDFLTFMDIDPDLHAPPVLVFTWGQLEFRSVLASASQNYTLFNSEGNPLRAKLNVTFQEYTNSDRESRAVGRQTADYTKTHVVAQGDTLAGLASQYYDDPALWRPIALRNRVPDPRALPTGLALVIPNLPYREPGSGRSFG